MRVLIAFGSKHGGTAEIAQTIGVVLREAGHAIAVQRADSLDGLQEYDAVVVGGALYAGRWTRSARRFVERNLDELAVMPVWFFSSGPLDASATTRDIAPTAQVQRLIERVGARDHKTFGGRLDATANGFIAQAMVKQGRGGDFRDMAAVKTWAQGIGAELAKIAPRARMPVPHPLRALRRLLVGLGLFTGLTAMAGGFELIRWPFGTPWMPGFNVSLLRHSPFLDFFTPGLMLFTLVGVLNLIAAALVLRRHRRGEILAFAGGCSISIWILVEIALLREFSWLQGLYLGIGCGTMAASLRIWLERRAAVRCHLNPPRIALHEVAALGTGGA